MTKEQKEIRLALRKIIELTAGVEPDGAVWGFDTEIANIDCLIDMAYKIIEPFLAHKESVKS